MQEFLVTNYCLFVSSEYKSWMKYITSFFLNRTSNIYIHPDNLNWNSFQFLAENTFNFSYFSKCRYALSVPIAFEITFTSFPLFLLFDYFFSWSVQQKITHDIVYLFIYIYTRLFIFIVKERKMFPFYIYMFTRIYLLILFIYIFTDL